MSPTPALSSTLTDGFKLFATFLLSCLSVFAIQHYLTELSSFRISAVYWLASHTCHRQDKLRSPHCVIHYQSVCIPPSSFCSLAPCLGNGTPTRAELIDTARETRTSFQSISAVTCLILVWFLSLNGSKKIKHRICNHDLVVIQP